MKKKIDLFGFKSFDEKVDNEDKDLNLQEQFFSQSIKHLKECRKSNKRANTIAFAMLVLIAIFILFAIISTSIAPTEVQANAQSEWYNYTLNINDVVLPFCYYGQNGNISQYMIIGYWESFTAYPTQYIKDFYYELYQPGTGDIYAKGIYTISNAALTSYYNYGANSNFTPQTRAYSQVDTYSFVQDGTTISYPIYAITNCELVGDAVNHSSIYFLFSTLGAVDIQSLRVRVILVDNMIQNRAFAEHGFPFLDCGFGDGSGRTFSVGTDSSYNTSTEPLYPIYESYETAFNVGKAQGFKQGYDEAKNEWYPKGKDEGSQLGYAEGKQDGIAIGKGQGYEEGVRDANDYTFFSLVSSFFDAPIKVILGDFDATTGQRVGGLLNFDLLGVNISSFLLAIFTICIIIAVIKLVLR